MSLIRPFCARVPLAVPATLILSGFLVLTGCPGIVEQIINIA